MTRPTATARLVALPDPPARSSLARAISDYQDALEAANKSLRTRSNYTEALRQFVDFLEATGRPTDIKAITRDDIRAFLVALQARPGRGGKPVTASTVANRFRALRAFFYFCADEEEAIIPKSPMARMEAPTVEELVVDVLTDTELRALLRATDGTTFRDRRAKAIIALFLETGLRLSELANLQVTDINVGERRLTVLGKGRRQRTITFRASMARILNRYMRSRDEHPASDSPYLWLGQRGRLNSEGIAAILLTVGKRAKVEHLHPHRFRHTWAHMTRLAGMNETDVAYLGGWRPGSIQLARYGRSAGAERARDNFRSPLDQLD